MTVIETTPLAKAAAPNRLLRKASALFAELWDDKVSFLGVMIIAILLACALFANFLAPFDPAAQSLRERLMPPAWLQGGEWVHFLGTDHLGRDVLSRVIYGSRVSLLVGGSVVLLAGTFGVVMGLFAGYIGGRVDNLIMRLADTQVAFPSFLLALLILAVIGASASSVIAVLSISGWMVYARVTRGIVQSIRQSPYIEAAEIVGCRPGRVIFKHILPNLMSPLLTLGILEFARVVLAEASLSFLGLGIQPPETSWGLDVAGGKDYIFNAWWLITFPGIAIALTVLGINLVAGWVRVTSDPQEREKRFARAIKAAKSRSKHKRTAR